MKPLILASESPRRKEILSFFKIPFTQAKPEFDEEEFTPSGDPIKFGYILAGGKAESVIEHYPGQLVLAADTLVIQDGHFFGKPRDRKEGVQFLQSFSGKAHKVITCLCLGDENGLEYDYGESTVYFNKLSDDQIEKYLDTNTWKDKAGGYSIQGGGTLVVKKIEGCFYNTMGLPLNALDRLLKKKGVDLWQYL